MGVINSSGLPVPEERRCRCPKPCRYHGSYRLDEKSTINFRHGWYSGWVYRMYVFPDGQFLVFEPYKNPVLRRTPPELIYKFDKWRRLKEGEQVNVEGWGLK